jgi:MFS family permease
MPIGLLAVIYLLFFLSGAASLVYQVVWVRSLTLVFGGSHLAVTAVLSIFMTGLAIGAYIVGRRVDRTPRLLRAYGLLELGIAASALLFIALTKVYPAIYVALARGRDDATLYLTLIRLVFSSVALIIPTILMGGTLPVLSTFVSRQPENLRGHLSFLYGLNTLGAVVGALLTGFVFLRVFAVSTTLYVAIVTNALIGVASLLLEQRTRAFSQAQSVPFGINAPSELATLHAGSLGNWRERVLCARLRGAVDARADDRGGGERLRIHHYAGRVPHRDCARQQGVRDHRQILQGRTA